MQSVGGGAHRPRTGWEIPLLADARERHDRLRPLIGVPRGTAGPGRLRATVRGLGDLGREWGREGRECRGVSRGVSRGGRESSPTSWGRHPNQLGVYPN